MMSRMRETSGSSVREILFQCMRGLNEQIDMLLRFRKRFMRARGR